MLDFYVIFYYNLFWLGLVDLQPQRLCQKHEIHILFCQRKIKPPFNSAVNVISTAHKLVDQTFAENTLPSNLPNHFHP